MREVKLLSDQYSMQLKVRKFLPVMAFWHLSSVEENRVYVLRIWCQKQDTITTCVIHVKIIDIKFPQNPFPFPTQDQFGKITDIKWSIRWLLLQKESMILFFIDDDSLKCQTICPGMGTKVGRIKWNNFHPALKMFAIAKIFKLV